MTDTSRPVAEDIVRTLASLDLEIANRQRHIPWHENITLDEFERHGNHLEMVYFLIRRAKSVMRKDPDDY